MMHVKQIKQLITDGQFSTAESQIEDLLALGPHNIEALKLKASLYGGKGHFQEALKVWLKVLEIAADDEDASAFIQDRQIEERERYYFTDELPDGGRRYMAYPRALVTISLWGIFGCVAFLLAIRFMESKNITLSTWWLFLGFVGLILSPWLAICYVYVKSLYSLTFTRQGVEVATRIANYAIKWNELEKVSFAHRLNPDKPALKLVLLPKSEDISPIIIDLSEGKTSLRARSFLPHEIEQYYKNVIYEELDSLVFKNKTIRKF